MLDGIKLTKRLRKILMAKRKKLKGRSAKHGKAPAPYTKYKKKEFVYSSAYYEWKHNILNKSSSSAKSYATNRVGDKRTFAMAAE